MTGFWASYSKNVFVLGVPELTFYITDYVSLYAKRFIITVTLENINSSKRNIGRSITIYGNIKMRVNRLNPLQKSTYFLKNQKWEKMENVQ